MCLKTHGIPEGLVATLIFDGHTMRVEPKETPYWTEILRGGCEGAFWVQKGAEELSIHDVLNFWCDIAHMFTEKTFMWMAVAIFI